MGGNRGDGGDTAYALVPSAIRGETLGGYGVLIAIGGGVGGWIAGQRYVVVFGVAGVLVFTGAPIVVVLSQRTTPTPLPELEPPS